MKITFLGAAREVTGSCILVETSSSRFLIDCGLFQGERLSEEKNFAEWPFDPATLDAVILTHAHLDHCGRIPTLLNHKFHGRLYATPPTTDLVPLILADAAKMLAREARHDGHAPLYDAYVLEELDSYWRAVQYDREVVLDETTSFRLINAGHILGSASVVLSHHGRSIVISGDIGNSPAPLIPPTSIPKEADVLVMESTYGDRIHEDRATRAQLLRELIAETSAEKGALLIPSFALERTQELLHEIGEFFERGEIPHIPVFLDSPLAIALTQVFSQYPDYFNGEAEQEFARNNFFNFPYLTRTPSEKDSEAIDEVCGPKIIIAGSGMMHGGRILRHAVRHLAERSTTLLIIGYQSEGTLGRRLFEGAQKVRILGTEVIVRAKVRAIGGYSAHADQQKLLEWIYRLEKKPHRLYLVHGEPQAQEALADKITHSYPINVTMPSLGESVTIA